MSECCWGLRIRVLVAGDERVKVDDLGEFPGYNCGIPPGQLRIVQCEVIPVEQPWRAARETRTKGTK